MAQVGFDCPAHGATVVMGDMKCADVCGPGGPNAFPAMMKRQIAGDASGKIVRLANVYRLPPSWSGLAAENIDAGAREVCGPNRGHIHVVGAAADAGPPDGR